MHILLTTVGVTLKLDSIGTGYSVIIIDYIISGDPGTGGYMDVDVDPDNEIPDLPEGEDKFIDIDEKPKKETKGGAAQDIPFVKIPSMDKTGMELAQRTFPKVQKQVGDAYSILSDPTDRDEYADYLVANLKLYFDQFDQESSPDIPEPESDPYNQIKQRSAQLSGIQENLVFTKLMKMLKG